MKVQRVVVDADKRQGVLEEYQMIGFYAEIVDNEIWVYPSKPAKAKKKPVDDKSERWSKRERNFGYTRG